MRSSQAQEDFEVEIGIFKEVLSLNPKNHILIKKECTTIYKLKREKEYRGHSNRCSDVTTDGSAPTAQYSTIQYSIYICMFRSTCMLLCFVCSV